MQVKTAKELEALINERFELGESRVGLSELVILPAEISGIDMRCVDFDGVDLSGKIFKGCDMRGVRLRASVLQSSQIIDCCVQGSDLEDLV